MAGVHGDEADGIAAAFAFSQRVSTIDFRGRVLIIPVANPMAFAAGRRRGPIDDLDLNRVCPGKADGSATEKLAAALAALIRKNSDFLFTLHGWYSAGCAYPHVEFDLASSPTQAASKLACAALAKTCLRSWYRLERPPNARQTARRLCRRCGEAATWDWRSGTLYWLDLYRPTLHALASARHQAYPIVGIDLVGCLVLSPASDLPFLVTRNAIGELQIVDGVAHFAAKQQLLEPCARVALSDGKVHPSGAIRLRTSDTQEQEALASPSILQRDAALIEVASGFVGLDDTAIKSGARGPTRNYRLSGANRATLIIKSAPKSRRQRGVFDP